MRQLGSIVSAVGLYFFIYFMKALRPPPGLGVATSYLNALDPNTFISLAAPFTSSLACYALPDSKYERRQPMESYISLQAYTVLGSSGSSLATSNEELHGLIPLVNVLQRRTGV